MKVVMTRKELDRRITDVGEYGENALAIVGDDDAPSGYSIIVSLGNGDERLPITVEN
jgi:hypothetical protein